MKKVLLFAIALVGILAAAAPAEAAPDTFGALYTTTNTDVDTGAEALTSSGPTNCREVILCNSVGSGGDIVRWKYSSTALSGTIGGVGTTGAPLFPVDTSGPVCTLPLGPNVNPRNFYVAAEGDNNEATLICVK